MSGVDAAEVRRIARLARLELADEEVERLAGEIGGILRHFEALADVDPDGLDAADFRPAPRLRRDVPDPDPLERPLEELAPEWRGGLFVVPRLSSLEARSGREDA